MYEERKVSKNNLSKNSLKRMKTWRRKNRSTLLLRLIWIQAKLMSLVRIPIKKMMNVCLNLPAYHNKKKYSQLKIFKLFNEQSQTTSQLQFCLLKSSVCFGIYLSQNKSLENIKSKMRYFSLRLTQVLLVPLKRSKKLLNQKKAKRYAFSFTKTRPY